MINLIKAEWFKLSKLLGFRILCLCNMAGVFSAFLLLALGSESTGCDVMLMSLSYILHHSVIGYFLAAVFLCSEFSSRTFSCGLLCGYSRRKVLWAKISVFLLAYLLLFLMYTGMIMLPMTVRNGFGQIQYQDILFLLFCGAAAYVATGSVIIFVALAVKRAYVTVGVGVAVTYCLLIARNFQGVWLPVIKYTYSRQTELIRFWGDGWGDSFSVWTFFVVQILTIIITLTGTVIIFEKMELK